MPVSNPFTPKSGWEPKVFVGREKEIEFFKRKLERARSGRCDHFLVLGDWGVGKTSLLKRLKEIAQEERILTTMARNYFAHDPMTLLTDRAAFERGVATLAAGLSQGSDKTLRQLEAVFAGLRKRLSYEADRGTHGLLTTRELRKGMEIEVIDKRTDRRLTGRVREVGELHFSVQIDHDAGSLREDSVVSTRIARDHRMWEFETKIIHSWNELIDFAHDHSPDEVNRRFFRRAYFRSAFVYAALPLAIGGDGAARAAFRKARVVDISAGGVGVRLDEDLAPGTQLLTCIQVGAAKRGLYVSILNQQVPLDFIVGQEASDGTLGRYKVLYLTDNHVSRAASARIAGWVKNGGKLFATAGAGLLDEANQPNTVLRELLGVEQAELVMPVDQQVQFIKQDTAFVKAIENVTMAGPEGGMSFPVFGIVSKIKAGREAQIRGTFEDQSPAIIARKVGKGDTVYCAFLPSLSYFRPAIPMKPLDRGSTDDAMSHFIPTEFDANVGRLIGSATAEVVPPVVSGARLVEPSLIQSKRGTAIVLANWSGQPIKELTLTANTRLPRKASLASGGAVKKKKEGGKRIYTFDLEIAGDVLILR